MKKILTQFINVLSILILFSLFSCKKNSETLLGEKQVFDYPEISFRVFQSNKFDFTRAISFQILNKDSAFTSKTFLTGTEDYNNNLDHFFTHSYDSIIALSYNDKNNVFAIYDLKSNTGFPISHQKSDYIKADELLAELMLFNPELYASWSQ